MILGPLHQNLNGAHIAYNLRSGEFYGTTDTGESVVSRSDSGPIIEALAKFFWQEVDAPKKSRKLT
jgi:hypothetical protein